MELYRILTAIQENECARVSSAGERESCEEMTGFVGLSIRLAVSLVGIVLDRTHARTMPPFSPSGNSIFGALTASIEIS